MVVTCEEGRLLSRLRDEVEKNQGGLEGRNVKKYGFKIPEGQPHSNDKPYFMCDDLELYPFSPFYFTLSLSLSLSLSLLLSLLLSLSLSLSLSLLLSLSLFLIFLYIRT